jgi:hypothetical protein
MTFRPFKDLVPLVIVRDMVPLVLVGGLVAEPLLMPFARHETFGDLVHSHSEDYSPLSLRTMATYLTTSSTADGHFIRAL